jgi:hypothetical protein
MNNFNNNDKKVAPVRQKKSTLTQQQKNKKRQRATPQQLRVLQNEFKINSTPNAKMREKIGQKIDMTERSVQIWFQNKRAKSKQFLRRNCTNSQYGSIQGFYEATPLISPKTTTFHNDQSGQTSYFSPSNFSDNNGTISISDTSKTLSKILLPCLSISIGTWRRVLTTVSGFSNLQVFFSLSDATMTYIMFNDTTKFLIKFPMEDVEMATYVESDSFTDIAHLRIEVTKRPSFYLKKFAMGNQWSRCQDFTELCQASSIFIHDLTGPAFQFKPQLLRIAELYPQKFCGLTTTTFSNDTTFTNRYSDSSLEINNPQSLTPSPMTNPPVFCSNLNEKASLLFSESENSWCFTEVLVSDTGSTTPALEPTNITCASPDYLTKSFEDNNSKLTQSFQQGDIFDITPNAFRHGSATSTDTILTVDTDISSLELSEPIKKSQDTMLTTAPLNLDIIEETTNFGNCENISFVSSTFGSEGSDVTESLQDDSLWALIQA